MYPKSQAFANTTGVIQCPGDGDLNRTRIEFKAALPGLEYIDDDQKSTSNLNVTRYGATVYSPNR
jgi:hypothetical protein